MPGHVSRLVDQFTAYLSACDKFDEVMLTADMMRWLEQC